MVHNYSAVVYSQKYWRRTTYTATMMKSSGEEVSNNNENAVANNSVGKLLIMRYRQSDYVHNAATAAANVLQEPGMWHFINSRDVS